MEHVVRAGDQVSSLECHQLGIARPGTHQRHPTFAVSTRRSDSLGQAVRLRHPTAAEQSSHVRAEQLPVDTRLPGKRHACFAEPAPQTADETDEGAPLRAKQPFDASAQGRGEKWALAGGRDGDQQGVAPHYRRGDEPALRRAVDDVDEDAGGLRLFPALPVDLAVLACIDHESRAREGTRPVFA